MIRLSRPLLPAVVLLAGLPMLGGCNSATLGTTPTAAAAVPPPVLPPNVHAEEIVGNWGYAAYRREQDRSRTIANAKGQCSPPYAIEPSPSGGVVMLGHDDAQKQNMSLKGSVQGKTYIGPGNEPAAADDREVVSFDGRVLILKWVDPEVDSRYGTMVLVRCEGRTRTAAARRRTEPPGAEVPGLDGPAIRAPGGEPPPSDGEWPSSDPGRNGEWPSGGPGKN